MNLTSSFPFLEFDAAWQTIWIDNGRKTHHIDFEGLRRKKIANLELKHQREIGHRTYHIWEINEKIQPICSSHSHGNHFMFNITSAKTRDIINQLRLTSFISSTTTSIEDGAFSHCSKLTTIIIPSSVITIGNDAFSQCTTLTSMTIPSSGESIGHDAFFRANRLSQLICPHQSLKVLIGVLWIAYESHL